jgi:hypothetical protein
MNAPDEHGVHRHPAEHGMTNQISRLTDAELDLVSGGRIAQVEGIDKSLDVPGAGFDPFNLNEWGALVPKGSV